MKYSTDEERIEAHRISARESARRTHAAKPGANAEKCRKYRLTHPEQWMLNDARKRSKAKGLDFTLEVSDIIIPEVCPIFKIPLIKNTGGKGATPNSPTLDRIDPSKGYVKGNVWVISWKANKLKSNATLDELRTLVSALETKQR